MKPFRALSALYWHMAGYSAARGGDYDYALSCFDRAADKRPTLLLSGYRAMVLTLLGRRAEAQTAFRELANAAKSKNPNDEYARLYACMVVAYFDNRLVDADRLAREKLSLKCRRSIKAILFPIDRPSQLVGSNQSPIDAERIKAHFRGLHAAYGDQIANSRRPPSGGS